MKSTKSESDMEILKQLEESEHKLRKTILQAPIAIGIFRGKDYLTEMANPRALELWGRKEVDVLNKPILEAMPELKEQGIKELLDEVYETGKTFSVDELPVQIRRNGKLETVFINFSYEPTHNRNGDIDGIMTVGYDISSQVIARKKIEDSEEFSRTILESSPDCLKILDMEGRLQYMNFNGLCQMEIDDFSKVKSKYWWNLWGSENEQIVKEAVDKALAGEIAQFIAYCPTAKGTPKWWDVMVSPVGKSGEAIHQIISVSRDITLQKNTDLKVLESEKKFRLLADSMPQQVWTADPQGNLNYYNQSVFDYSGLSLEQINKDRWIQIVHCDDRESNIKAWTESVTTGKDFLFEHRFRRHDGIYRWQLSRAIPQRDEHGKIQMWVGTSTDIEEQKNFRKELEKQVEERTAELIQLNESLKKSEERYHLMVEEVQDYAILYLSRQGIVENWNAGAEKIKGYTAEEIIGKNFSNFYNAEDRQNHLPQKLLDLAVQTGKAVQEGWRVKKDGGLFWASVVITAVHNDKKEIIGFSKVTHDLTDKKNAEDELKRNKFDLEAKNRTLHKMNKELQSFAYISSHDLQEPLRKIQTFASRITQKEKDNLSDTGKDLFRRMQNAAERMQSLIDDLLAYSRTNTAERNFEKVNLNTVIEKAIQDLKEEIEQKHAEIEIKETCDVNIIPFQFRQLFYNLISNSLKFSNPDHPLHITIDSEYGKGNKFANENLESNANYCHISVADNGIGFEPQYSERIFELFQRLYGKDEYPGTGIGLAIVKRIVENHNGIITAKGELGRGATFDIYLPLDDK